MTVARWSLGGLSGRGISLLVADYRLSCLVLSMLLCQSQAGSPPMVSVDENVNDNTHLSVEGMFETLGINFGVFVILMMIFESNRFYKQIYLKRLQNRFRVVDRVPPYPSESTFGWLFEIRKVSETDFLRMVGLDAYMCLRFIVVCYKLSLFLTFWGILVLVPLYGTAADTHAGNPWDRFSISNIMNGDESVKNRLWISAIFGYVFAAYFCQLLHTEYNNFSVRRLQYLVQADPDSDNLDPDTPPQKYFTVMIERIPAHLRSAPALYQFFDKIFPGDVYTVEIALDLHELDAKNAKRKRLRHKLEKAIAHYEARNERPLVRARVGNFGDGEDLGEGIFGEDSLMVFLKKLCAPERLGYHEVDAINYYTGKLQKYNDDVKELQKKYYEQAVQADEKLQRKFKNRYDTRVAALFENIQVTGSKTLQDINTAVNEAAEASRKNSAPTASLLDGDVDSTGNAIDHGTHKKGFSIENILFGKSVKAMKPTDMATIYEQEMRRVERIAEDHHREATMMKAVEAMKKTSNRHASTVVNTHHMQEVVTAVEELPPSLEPSVLPPEVPTPPTAAPSTPPADKSRRPFSNLPPLFEPVQEEEEDSSSRRTLPSSHNSPITSNVPFSNAHPPNSADNDGDIDELTHDYLGEALNNVVIGDENDSSHSRHSHTDNLRGSFRRTSGNNKTYNYGGSRSNHGLDHSTHSVQSTYSTASQSLAPATSMLEQDHTLSQWMRASNVDFEKEEIESRKRSESFAHLVHQGAQHNYWDATTFLSGGSNAIPTGGAMKKRNSKGSLASAGGTSSHGGQSILSQLFPGSKSDVPLPNHSTHSTTSNAAHNDEVRRASYLSSMASKVMQQRPNTKGTYSSVPNAETAVNPLHQVHSEEDEESRVHSIDHHIAAVSPHLAEQYDNYVDLESTKTPAQHALLDSSVHSARTAASAVEPSQFPVRRFSSNALHPSHTSHAAQGLQQRTDSGGVSNVLPMLDMLSQEQLSEITKLSVEKARLATKQGWIQTKLAGTGAMKGILELERTIEMVMLGAYYKYSSTAFVTFKSRVTESIAQQMLLSHDAMEINHAPNPKDVIWDNVSIPKSQVVLRNWITNAGIIVGSIFWSSLVNSVNVVATFFPLPQSQQQMISAAIMLVFLLILPFIFDYLARFYEGMKTESEIQNSIMTRYFWYQLINVYVTVGFSGANLWAQMIQVLTKPSTLVDIIGGRVPDVSLFFVNLVIIKVFTAVPLEMIRPWQLSTIHLMGNCMDRRKTTRRDLRTGAFFSWPMLYGWIYPQLMMVLMIMLVYSCITPLLMPFGALFFAFIYLMYKYQLLYVYINEYQSGGYMWYAVFARTVILLEFGSCALLGYLALQLANAELSGPFFFLLPLPVCLMYFRRYCDHKFKKASMNLSYGFARELDHRNVERKAAGKAVPHDKFAKDLYRQPSLTEKEVLPEPYRNDGTYDVLKYAETGESVVMADWRNHRMNRRGSLSINVHELTDEGEEDHRVLSEYWKEVVLPLSVIPEGEEDGSEGGVAEVVMTRERR